ncbi:NAD-dependent DNA ligase LigA [Psychrilyobacter sp.]|uniref:NAD-dependent DNA ligase LigA n=1 Tax=Psychrilyobacter sp. TaxID=2586924 RepID=UPI00301A1F2F
MNKNIELEIKKIKENLHKHNYYYYEKNESLIADVEYDKLLKKLEKLEEENPEYKTTNSPTLVVGEGLKGTKFTKVTHKKPMLSLSNTYNVGDLEDFDKRVKRILNKDSIENENTQVDYALELKLDGISISIHYVDGRLIQAVTRGNGKVGEDVTENIMQIRSIPKYLKESVSIEVRGEIVLPLTEFESLNKKRLESGEEVFANPRNAAGGTLRQKDAAIVGKRNLDAYIYYLADSEELGFETHIESIKYLEELGFKTTKVFDLCETIEHLEIQIKYWEIERNHLDYETDGLVIKVNNLSLYEELGATTKAPRWAISYKFPAKQVTTKLKDITWQVGRTGKVTPVAELEAVEVSGSIVRRASLHNYDEVLRKDIKIGDTVFIEKAAEIIPQVIKPVKELRDGTEEEIIPPTNCPVCDSILEKEEGLVNLKCMNTHCKAKLQGRMEYFISRDAMNIIGGSKIVEKFIGLGFLKEISDFYELHLKKDELEKLDNLGSKSIEKLLISIEESKKLDYSKTLYALGIPFVGKFLGELLSKESKNIENLALMEVEELLAIDGVGGKVAQSVYGYFRDGDKMRVLEKIKEAGVNFEIEEVDEGAHLEEFVGKTFLATGKSIHFKRQEIKDIVEKLGGSNMSGVSKKLDYLIVGEKPGSKLKKAEELGSVKILTEEEFLELIK